MLYPEREEMRGRVGVIVPAWFRSDSPNEEAVLFLRTTLADWSAGYLPAAYQGTPLGNASVPSDQARVKYIANNRLPREIQRLQLDRLAAIQLVERQGGAPQALEYGLSPFAQAGSEPSEVE